jgi:hypothetical protein
MQTDDSPGPGLAGKRWLVRARGRQIAILTSLFAAGIVGLSLVLLSPLGLRQLSTIHGLNWARLSEVGQAYGATAAILSALALIGVTAALFVQARDARTSQEHTARSFHLELTRLAMENSDLRPVTGLKDSDPSEDRRRMYANLWLTYWRSMYRLGSLNEKELRQGLSDETFSCIAGRQLWKAARLDYLDSATDRRTREFCRIVDDEYRKAIQSKELMPQKAIHSQFSLRLLVALRWTTVLLLGGTAAVLWRALTRGHTGKPS